MIYEIAHPKDVLERFAILDSTSGGAALSSSPNLTINALNPHLKSYGQLWSKMKKTSITFERFPRGTVVLEELGAQNWTAEALGTCSNVL